MIGDYQVEEAALLFCFVALSAIILYFMVPERLGVARTEAPKPVRTLSRPHWAERPAAETPTVVPIEIEPDAVEPHEAPLRAAA
jgi:hypothetical protein